MSRALQFRSPKQTPSKSAAATKSGEEGAVFAPGDTVVYPAHGVGTVLSIASETIAGQALDLIQITFSENRMTLRIPVRNATRTGLRKLSSRRDFDAVLAVLKGKPKSVKGMWSRRIQEYQAKINSGDPMAVAEVARDLKRGAGGGEPSFSERAVMEAAVDRLAGELAAVEAIDRASAASRLNSLLAGR